MASLFHELTSLGTKYSSWRMNYDIYHKMVSVSHEQTSHVEINDSFERMDI